LEVATTLFDDFSKTVKRAPIKKTNSNQQHKKEVVAAAIATTLPALVATINPQN
jgi:hypothetical protein